MVGSRRIELCGMRHEGMHNANPRHQRRDACSKASANESGADVVTRRRNSTVPPYPNTRNNLHRAPISGGVRAMVALEATIVLVLDHRNGCRHSMLFTLDPRYCDGYVNVPRFVEVSYRCFGCAASPWTMAMGKSSVLPRSFLILGRFLLLFLALRAFISQ
jgi:hypothetical protein